MHNKAMKSTPYRIKRAGFTMLEIVVVLSIMVLVIGIGFSSFAVLDDEDPFEQPAQKLTQMSRFAIHASVLQQRAMTIAFDKKGFSLLGSTVPEGAYYTVPQGMKVLIHRMGGRDWEKAEGHFWRFGEQGICEPIQVRFESTAGFRDLKFHPLTGTPVE